MGDSDPPCMVGGADRESASVPLGEGSHRGHSISEVLGDPERVLCSWYCEKPDTVHDALLGRRPGAMEAAHRGVNPLPVGEENNVGWGGEGVWGRRWGVSGKGRMKGEEESRSTGWGCCYILVPQFPCALAGDHLLLTPAQPRESWGLPRGLLTKFLLLIELCIGQYLPTWATPPPACGELRVGAKDWGGSQGTQLGRI